jgi:hypothetical protein
MADAKFPGTDLSLLELVEKSWRLDHPNFGDVYRTTFAKGVIGDGGDGTDSFFVASSIPIQVKSMVKVEGDAWGVSEFIPLFYHPKAGYWNDLPPSGDWGPSTRLIPNVVSTWDHFHFYYGRPFEAVATDLKEGGFFERAWMSFRCGDEVIVMLQGGVPVAVIGHADGVPRVGEDLIRFCWKNSYKVVFRACVGEVYCQGTGRSGGPLDGTPFCDDIIQGEDGTILNLTQSARTRAFSSARVWYREFFVAVGPIEYIIQVGGLYTDYSRLNIRAALYSKKWFDALPLPESYESYIFDKLTGIKNFDPNSYWWGPDYPFSAPQDCFTDRLYWNNDPWGTVNFDDILTVPHTKDGVPE